MIGCISRVLEVPRVVVDTKVPRILWVKCATSAECQTIRTAMSTVNDSWVVLLRLCPYVSEKQHKLEMLMRITISWRLSCVKLLLNIDICNPLIHDHRCIINMTSIDHTCIRKTILLPIGQHSDIITHMSFCYHSWVACEYIQTYSLACPWLFTWPGMEEREYEEECFGDEHVN